MSVRETYLYVVCYAELSGPCKIGMTENPRSRLRSLQTGNPQTLRFSELWGGMTRDGADFAEKYLHRWLSGRRLAGEWFDGDPEFITQHAGFVISCMAAAAAGDSIPPVVGMIELGLATAAGEILP